MDGGVQWGAGRGGGVEGPKRHLKAQTGLQACFKSRYSSFTTSRPEITIWGPAFVFVCFFVWFQNLSRFPYRKRTAISEATKTLRPHRGCVWHWFACTTLGSLTVPRVAAFWKRCKLKSCPGTPSSASIFRVGGSTFSTAQDGVLWKRRTTTLPQFSCDCTHYSLRYRCRWNPSTK